jgi:hypothetical protein
VSAALDNGTVVINVVNRHRDQPVDTEFEAEDKQFGGAYEVAEVNGPDIKSENTFGSTAVQTTRKSAERGRSQDALCFSAALLHDDQGLTRSGLRSSHAFRHDQGNVVLLFLRTELTHFADDGIEQFRGRQVAAPA